MRKFGSSSALRWSVGCGTGVALLLNASCSTTTTIYRNSGAPLEATVVGGTPTSIVLESGNGQDEVLRSDVYEYDYPGNVHANIGGVVLGYGLLNIAVGLSQCDEQPSDRQAAFCAGVFLPAVLGAGMLVWGLVVNRSARTAVADRSGISALPEPKPFPRRARPLDARPAPSRAVLGSAQPVPPPTSVPASSAAPPEAAPSAAGRPPTAGTATPPTPARTER